LQLGQTQAWLHAGVPRLFIGRDTACGLVGTDPTMSRRHAEVFLDGTNVYIRDLGSANGTWVDGQPLGPTPVALKPGQQIYVGHVPLGVSGTFGGGSGATVVGAMPPDLIAMIEARKAAMAKGSQVAAQAAAAAPATSPQARPAQAPAPAPQQGLGLGGKAAPLPADFAYRRQGANGNGSLLIALKQDTFDNTSLIDGFVEFTALDDETVASIMVELIEYNRKGAKEGHGPWETHKGAVLPLPFQLRVPPGTSISGGEVWWEIHGYVDINWALDIEANCPIHMRNVDVERIRDALGSLDYRIVNLESQALGQRFKGKFHPPTQWREQWGISDVNLEVEYLGSNLQVKLEVEKTSMFRFDKKLVTTFDLQRLRTASLPEISAHFQQQIEQMMAR
jgi:pSer/pThr/pTyr-binding forkhead associated (FHA) protein